MDHLKTGRDVLRKEAEALMKVMEGLDDTFNRAAEIIFGCTGRVVLTGMGKSGLVCKKIAATFSSTGTPALFVHPADSLHGDLGMLQRGDVLVVVSNSGETEEVLKIIPWVKRLDIPFVVITGDAASTIARLGDVALAVNVEEACPYNVCRRRAPRQPLPWATHWLLQSWKDAPSKWKTSRLSTPGVRWGGSCSSGWRTSCTPVMPSPGYPKRRP